MLEGIIALCFLFFLLASGVWVAVALALTGILSLVVFTDFPSGQILAMQVFNWNNQFVLVALPLFIFMGELLFHSKLNSQLYTGLQPLVSGIPGKLLHSNVVGCTLFAAVSGSSTATLATVGSVAIPELQALGYDRRILLGSLAGAGTLGLLIPPSIVMIIYCVLVRESVGQLFMAGIIPGLIISGLFFAYITIAATIRPQLAPAGRRYSWGERFTGLIRVIPTALLIFLVLGGMYLGWSTPTEAAALGCGGAMILGLINRTFTWDTLKGAVAATVLVAGMMLFIITGASFYATSVAYLGFSQEIMDFIVSMEISRYMVLLFICIIYLGLGCLMDGGSMLVLTVPIIHPTMMALGFDSIWLGVVLVILIEVAQITPPIGLNLYVLSGISGDPIDVIVRSSLPFFFLLLLGCVIIILFPDLALWLPQQMILKH